MIPEREQDLVDDARDGAPSAPALSMVEVLRYRLIVAMLPPLKALGPKAP